MSRRSTAPLVGTGIVLVLLAATGVLLPPAAAVPLPEKKKTEEGEKADPAVTANNLKKLGIALHDFHDKYGRFPAAATYSKDGKPLLSWRVALLPYLGHEDLYKQFKLDEPWDSEHNLKLLAKMPRVFAATGARDVTATHYQAFVGQGAAFEGGKGIRITDFTDGTSNTVLLAEASQAVPWTKPEDLPFAPQGALPKLGGLFEFGFHVLMADGSVHIFKPRPRDDLMRMAITRNGGEVIPEELEK